MQKVIIIGAGPVGLLLAHYLLRPLRKLKFNNLVTGVSGELSEMSIEPIWYLCQRPAFFTRSQESGVRSQKMEGRNMGKRLKNTPHLPIFPPPHLFLNISQMGSIEKDRIYVSSRTIVY